MTRQRDRESELLRHLLSGAGIENYVVKGDNIWIPFIYSNPELFEEETEIWLVASLREHLISIEMPLLELDQDQNDLDPTLAQMLGEANRNMGVAQFTLNPYELSIRADFDASYLRYGEIEAGVEALFQGFAMYIAILYQWLGSLVENEAVDFKKQGRVNEKEIQKVVQGEQSAMDSTKKQIIQALVGIVHIGVTVAVISGIGTAAGLPPPVTAAIITAALGSKSKVT